MMFRLFYALWHSSSSFYWFVKRFYTKALGNRKTCIIFALSKHIAMCKHMSSVSRPVVRLAGFSFSSSQPPPFSYTYSYYSYFECTEKCVFEIYSIIYYYNNILYYNPFFVFPFFTFKLTVICKTVRL